MFSPIVLRSIALAALAGLGAACAADSDRYPSLSLRDFERVQGQFPVAPRDSSVLQPAPLSVEQISQVSDSVAAARSRHAIFMKKAVSARALVANAAGTSPEDNRWSLALVEIADLDSRMAATASLLADLDLLYTDASLEFEERTAIAEARSNVGDLVALEAQIVDELVDTLSGTATRSP